MGTIVLDAGVVIGFYDEGDAHYDTAWTAIVDVLTRGDTLVIPASVLAEVLVGPVRRGQGAVDEMRSFIADVPIEIVPVDDRIAEAAARLRARVPTLRLPDALVIATAQVIEADRLITTDRRWPDVTDLGVPVEVLRAGT